MRPRAPYHPREPLGLKPRALLNNPGQPADGTRPRRPNAPGAGTMTPATREQEPAPHVVAERPGGLDTPRPSRGRGRRGKPAREGGITGAPRPAPPQDDDRSGEGRTDRTENWGTGGSRCIHLSNWNDITPDGSRRTQNRARKGEVERREGVRSYYSAERRNTLCRRSNV